MFWPIVTPSSCLDIAIIDTLKTMSDLLCEAISADEVKLICIYSSNVMDATSKSTTLAKLALRSTLSRKKNDCLLSGKWQEGPVMVVCFFWLYVVWMETCELTT